MGKKVPEGRQHPTPSLTEKSEGGWQRAQFLPTVSLTCYHLPVKWQTPWRIFRSLSFSQTSFPTQNSILAQSGSRVSAKLVGMFTPQSLCVSQFLETPHKWIKIAAPISASFRLPLCLPVAPSLSSTGPVAFAGPCSLLRGTAPQQQVSRAYCVPVFGWVPETALIHCRAQGPGTGKAEL